MINPTKKSKFSISVILPALNEQDNINVMVDELTAVLAGFNYEIIFVDDGSQDNTINVLKQWQRQNSKIRFLSLSKNFGHQNALKAGIDHAKGDALICMDCDLQHPPSLIVEMIGLWQQGDEIIYTIRQESSDVPFLKRAMTGVFYRILNFFSEVSIIQGRADFFLIDRKVADILKDYDESPLFFRGILSSIGFNQKSLSYKLRQRFSGKTKYSFKKMVEFALDGITSFSVKPLRIAVFCGGALSMGAFIFFLYMLYVKIFTANAISGWASIISCVLLLGGIQLIILGIMGEYLGKLFISSKRRPIYIVREKSE